MYLQINQNFLKASLNFSKLYPNTYLNAFLFTMQMVDVEAVFSRSAQGHTDIHPVIRSFYDHAGVNIYGLLQSLWGFYKGRFPSCFMNIMHKTHILTIMQFLNGNFCSQQNHFITCP